MNPTLRDLTLLWALADESAMRKRVSITIVSQAPLRRSDPID